jgi:hypothetical protein
LSIHLVSQFLFEDLGGGKGKDVDNTVPNAIVSDGSESGIKEERNAIAHKFELGPQNKWMSFLKVKQS